MRDNQVTDEELVPITSLVFHDKFVEHFSCGEEDIDKYLKERAKKEEESNLSSTWTYITKDKLLGFFTICITEIQLTKQFKIKKNKYFDFKSNSLSKYPAIKINYFAIQKDLQRSGVGTDLMRALYNIVANIMLQLKMPILVVEAMDDGPAIFYEKFGFANTDLRVEKGFRLMAITTKELEEIVYKIND